MKIGLCIPRPRFPKKQQVEMLLAADVAAGKIYVEGENGETREDAFKATRDKIIYCPDGLRVFGTAAKAIRAGLIDAEKRGIVLVDHAAGHRSDKHGWKMYDLAVGRGKLEERKLDRRAAKRGGDTRAARYANDRLKHEEAERVWKDQRFTTAEKACAYMNELHPPKIEGHKGWTPGIAFREFGGSGRPRGRKSSKTDKQK